MPHRGPMKTVMAAALKAVMGAVKGGKIAGFA